MLKMRIRSFNQYIEKKGLVFVQGPADLSAGFFGLWYRTLTIFDGRVSNIASCFAEGFLHLLQ
jgi:hypothetical protein